MDESKKSDGGKAGGKTAGVAGGALAVWLTSTMPEGHALKPYALYVAPIVAVFCKDWGGALIYQVKAHLVFHWKHFLLSIYKRRVDKIPDHPDFEHVKKEASKDYINAMSDLLKENISSLKKISQLLDEKDAKSGKDDEKPEKQG